MHGLNIPTWDERPGGLDYFLIRDGDNPVAVGTFPGTTIRVPRGVVFHADTQGHGPPPHTIHWHGLEPTPVNDGVGNCSMEIGRYTYQLQPNFIGSYFYHCHRNTVQHFEFGLYGFFVVETPDAFFASLNPDGTLNPAIPIGAGRDGKRRTAANLTRVNVAPPGQPPAFEDLSGFFGGFKGGLITDPDPLGQFATDPHAMTVTYDVEALWVFDDRDSRWSDLGSNPRATFPRHGDVPGVNDRFHENVGQAGFFAFNDFHADYWFVTGVPVAAPKGGTGTLPTGITVPRELNSGVEGTQVPIRAEVGQTILLRCLNGAYGCAEITFPVSVVIIAWDGRALGVPPYGQYNHAYTVPAGTPIHISVARRFDALIKLTEALPAGQFATVKFIDTRGQVPDPEGVFPADFAQDVLFTALIPMEIGGTPAPVESFTVSGLVTDEAGAPLEEPLSIRIEPMSLAGSKPAPAPVQPDGTFTVAGLANGMYEVIPVLPDGLAAKPPFQRVTVNGANVVLEVAFVVSAAPYSVAEAEEALDIARDGRPPTADEIGRLDIGPIMEGQSHPDGAIDLHDVVTILKMATGSPL
ncbi:MAG: multicopper oxidase domain-containing protein [Deltaproteobacteria bacterium]|nr:multicopper oxidase domain-containing protein [Deltaproteobacteria bacterium]